jgi:dolichol-phosphate mannosyltransferase
MTLLGGARQGVATGAAAIASDIVNNLRAWMAALLVGPPRRPARKVDYRALLHRHRWQVVVVLGLVAVPMLLVDPFTGAVVRRLPFGLVAFFNDITDFGRSSWVLIPLGALIVLLAALASPALDRFSRGVFAALGVRVGFVFVAIGLPALAGTILKRIIGRVRPSAQGVFAYYPFSWRSDYASLPSGHAITAFGALVAIGLLIPRARPLLWVYALTIAASRVIVSAHFPSDVIAGAAFGAFGAILVREWFASRGLGFYVDANGTVLITPGPSIAHTKTAITAALDHRFPRRWRMAVLALPGRLFERVRQAVTRALDRKPQFEWNALRLAFSGPAQSGLGAAIKNGASDLDPARNRNIGAPTWSEGSRIVYMTGALAAIGDDPAPLHGAERPRVTVVVPVRNEAGNIAPLVEQIAASLAAKGNFEVVYVDDGSTDGTGAEIEGLRETRPWLRHVRHVASCGQSAAVRTGVAASRAALIVTLDGDGQNDPAFLPALLGPFEQNPRLGLVAGQRVGRKDTGFKKMQSRIANTVRSAVLRDGTRDTGCGLKAFRRDVFLALPYFDGLHRFLPALVRRDGYEIAYVDVIDRPRLAGVSNYGMWDRLWVGILDLFGVWWLIRRRARVPQAMEVVRDVG